MIRRLGCLSALLSLLLFVAVFGAIGWFGYQAYVHASDAQAVASRTNDVGQAWTDDPATLALAAAGKGGLRPKSLSSQPFQRLGARPVVSASVSKATVTLTTSRLGCDEPPLVADVVETPVLVQVLVHPESPWIPDVPRMWRQWRGTTSCSAGATPATVTVTLGTPLGRRVLVDATTGQSVAHK